MPNVFTLTLNPALDISQFVADPALGKLNRASKSFYSASGKGLNVSRGLSRQGRSSVAVLPLGGLFGSTTQSLLGRGAAYFIPEVVPIQGETRCNLKINDEATGTLTEFNDASPHLSAAELEACQDVILSQVKARDIVVIAGSLPGSVAEDSYAKLIKQFKKKRALTFLDTGGAALTAGLKAKPTLVKPNKLEAEAALGVTLSTYGDAVAAAKGIAAKGVKHVLLTLGAKGAVFAAPEGCYVVKAPPIQPRSTSGCGDAILAGYTFALLEAWDLPRRCVHAVATATARALMERPRFPDPALIQPHLEALEVLAEMDIDPSEHL